MKQLVALLFSAVAFLGLARAQLVENPRVLMGFDLDSLEGLAVESGWGTERVTEGDDTLLVITVGGRHLALWPRACDSEGRCGGLYVFSLIPSRSTTALTNGFNVQYNPARATLRNGQVVLDRYLTGDFGVTRGGLSIELQLQAKLIDDWWAYAKANQVATTAVSFSPLIKELPPVTAVSHHLDELSLTDTLLDQIASGNGPRGKD